VPGAFVLHGATHALFDPVGGNRGETLMASAQTAWSRAIAEAPGQLAQAFNAVSAVLERTIASHPPLAGGGVSIAAVTLNANQAHGACTGAARIFVVQAGTVREPWPAQQHSALKESARGVRLTPNDRLVLASAALAQHICSDDLLRLTTGVNAALAAKRIKLHARAQGRGRQHSVLVLAVEDDSTNIPMLR
jgi:hypothetical protein